MEEQKIDPKEVIALIKESVKAGTFYETKGLWDGEVENSLKFECVNIEDNFRDDSFSNSVKDLKEELEEAFSQESVMVKQYEADVRF